MVVVKGSREEGGDFAVSNGPQCGAHAGEGLSVQETCFPRHFPVIVFNFFTSQRGRGMQRLRRVLLIYSLGATTGFNPPTGLVRNSTDAEISYPSGGEAK